MIVLDSYQSGALVEVPSAVNEQVSVIGNGVTILTACHRTESATENEDNVFITSILLDSLQGSWADICG